jgi:PIN domain nuclease of toxin-antitoxin system
VKVLRGGAVLDPREAPASAPVRARVELSAEHGLAVAHLPLHRSDPFDRLLVAPAALDGLTL